MYRSYLYQPTAYNKPKHLTIKEEIRNFPISQRNAFSELLHVSWYRLSHPLLLHGLLILDQRHGGQHLLQVQLDALHVELRGERPEVVPLLGVRPGDATGPLPGGRAAGQVRLLRYHQVRPVQVTNLTIISAQKLDLSREQTLGSRLKYLILLSREINWNLPFLNLIRMSNECWRN